MPIKLLSKVDTTKITVQQRFAISNIYDTSFGLNTLNGRKAIFKAAKIILKSWLCVCTNAQKRCISLNRDLNTKIHITLLE